jgi:hypothetical protein
MSGEDGAAEDRAPSAPTMSEMHPLLSAYLLALSLPVNIDAQKHPLSALLLFAIAAGLLWFAVAQTRRRDARRAGRSRRSDTWSRRPPRY